MELNMVGVGCYGAEHRAWGAGGLWGAGGWRAEHWGLLVAVGLTPRDWQGAGVSMRFEWPWGTPSQVGGVL